MLAHYLPTVPRKATRALRSIALMALSNFVLVTSLFARGTMPAPSSSLTTRLVNLEATSNETFRFNATLHNGGRQAAVYQLKTVLPAGWTSILRANGMELTAVQVDSGKSQDLSIELKPSIETKPGTYRIPLTAVTDGETLQLELQAVVKGSYNMVLTTPSGRLSEELTEGSQKNIHLSLKNAGTLPLENVSLSAQTASGWEISFSPQQVDRLEPGKTLDITADIKVPEKTIAGDYMATMTARSNGTSTNCSYRISVTTSWLAGWIGLVIIMGAVALIYFLIRKYGRR